MATSTCPKCPNQTFELAVCTPIGSPLRLHLVQCTQCGAVVGVTAFEDLAHRLADLDAQVEQIQRALQ